MHSPHLRCHNTCVIRLLWLLISYHSDLAQVNTFLESHQANASGNWQVLTKTEQSIPANDSELYTSVG